jgi:phosphatidylserine decarboxylase
MAKSTIKLIGLLPQNVLSKWAGKVMNAKWSKYAIPLFIRFYGINTKHLTKPITDYKNLNEFFTRYLQPQAFVVDPNERAVTSPVNGTLSEFGKIDDGNLLQAKNTKYTLDGLLGGGDEVEVYRNGFYITLYLAPSDYHRVHTPLKGEIVGYRYIPGRLFPVNKQAVRHVGNLFSKNERLVSHMNTSFGSCSIVQVGAFLVGSAKVVYADVQTNSGIDTYSERLKQPVSKDKGNDLGWFEFGSTVILLLEDADWEMCADLQKGQKIKMGQSLCQNIR